MAESRTPAQQTNRNSLKGLPWYVNPVSRVGQQQKDAVITCCVACLQRTWLQVPFIYSPARVQYC